MELGAARLIDAEGVVLGAAGCVDAVDEGAELVGALPVATSAVKVSSWTPKVLFQGRPQGTYVVQPIGDVGGEAAPQHLVLVHRVR